MDVGAPQGPRTLAIDIGGTRLKAGTLDPSGVMIAGPERVDTPHPAWPDKVVPLLLDLAGKLGEFDRISIGFPGVVRDGAVLTAPNLGTEQWHGFPLAQNLSEQLGRPARLLNDASVQALGVITGHGIECVITLGTGMGFALFRNGVLGPQLELGQHPARKDKTYDQYIGNAALQKVGPRRWNKRLDRVIRQISVLTTYQVLYIGGGNAKAIDQVLPEGVKIVPNKAGITGGVKLWDPRLQEVFPA
ncbi:MAG: ROK family protein [Acetobacteraceae bacterium]|nr:ROK family protein [Acetobacteraceae bacterium]